MKSGDRRPPLRGAHTREDADRRRCHQKAPKAHEESTAKALGGRRQSGSGSQYHAKGDVADVDGGRFDFHGECKTTEGKSLRLEALWLNKITSEAADLFKYPFLAIRFRKRVLDELTSTMWRKLGKPVTTAEQDWVAVPRSVFVKMLEELGVEDFDG
jgi:hypothetical protein